MYFPNVMQGMLLFENEMTVVFISHDWESKYKCILPSRKLKERQWFGIHLLKIELGPLLESLEEIVLFFYIWKVFLLVHWWISKQLYFFHTSLPLWTSSYCIWAICAAWVLSLRIIFPHFLSVSFFSCDGRKMNGRNQDTYRPPFPVCKWHSVVLWNNSPFPKIRGDTNEHGGER